MSSMLSASGVQPRTATKPHTNRPIVAHRDTSILQKNDRMATEYCPPAIGRMIVFVVVVALCLRLKFVTNV